MCHPTQCLREGPPWAGAGMGAWALGTHASPCLVLFVSLGPLLPCSWSASSPCPSVQQPQAVLSSFSTPCPTSHPSAHTTAAPPGTSGPLHMLFPQLETLPLHLPRLPLLVTIPQKRGPFSHPEPMWYPLKCELPRAGALSVSRGFVCLTYSRCSVSTH